MARSASIVLFGAGGHGKVVADCIEKQGGFVIVGWIDDTRTGEFYGYPILGTRDALSGLRAKDVQVIVTIGKGEARAEAQKACLAAGLSIATVIHPSAQIARTATIGAGTVVMPCAVVGPDTVIGQGSIINTSATVDHDCVLGAYVHISPGTHLAGNVHVGTQTHVGIGSSVREGIVIGQRVTVGAGSAVVENLPDGCTAYGVPAKPVLR